VLRAVGAVAWARRWRTFQAHYDLEAALQGAWEALGADPRIEPYDLARVAIQAAARGAVVERNDGGPLAEVVTIWDLRDARWLRAHPAPTADDERRAREAVELASTWPSWRPDRERVAYTRAREKAWREPEATTRALAMAARYAASRGGRAKTS